jgi:hypothetical protein
MFAVALLAAVVTATPSAMARPTGPTELGLLGEAFYPESIAAAPGGALFVSSLVTGEILRFPPDHPSRDQPTSLAFQGGDIGITEGQVLRLQAGQQPSLPFKAVRRPADAVSGPWSGA